MRGCWLDSQAICWLNSLLGRVSNRCFSRTFTTILLQRSLPASGTSRNQITSNRSRTPPHASRLRGAVVDASMIGWRKSLTWQSFQIALFRERSPQYGFSSSVSFLLLRAGRFVTDLTTNIANGTNRRNDLSIRVIRSIRG